MTITSEPSAISYDGDDSTVDFTINFKYFSKSDILATHRDASGVETVWVLDSDFSLTAAGVESGGTLTATTAPATGETLVIELDPPNTQDSSLPLGGSFPSTVVEDELDQTVQRDVKIQRLFERSLRVPTTDSQIGSDLDLPIDSDRANKFLAFDGNGKPIIAAGTSADLTPVSIFVNSLLDDADADTFVQSLVTDLTAETAPATDDTVLIGDTDEVKGNKMTLANLLKVINVLTADASPDHAADYLLTYDADAAAVKKVLLETLIKAGAWTPTIQDSSLSDAEGQTYTTQVGAYLKLGDYVLFHGEVVITGLGTLTSGDNAFIGGLPFTSHATNRGFCGVGFGSSLAFSAGVSLDGFISTSVDYISLRSWDVTTGQTPTLISELTAGTRLIFGGQYLAA